MSVTFSGLTFNFVSEFPATEGKTNVVFQTQDFKQRIDVTVDKPFDEFQALSESEKFDLARFKFAEILVPNLATERLSGSVTNLSAKFERLEQKVELTNRTFMNFINHMIQTPTLKDDVEEIVLEESVEEDDTPPEEDESDEKGASEDTV